MSKARYLKEYFDIVGFKFERLCEVGVWLGDFVKDINNKFPGIKEHWGVDPYCVFGLLFSNTELGRLTQNDPDKWEKIYYKTSRLQLKYSHFVLLRQTSKDAYTQFKHGYFDFVFIDGDHRYEHVKNDIEWWYPKVRKDGFIGGHDYGNQYVGVRQAVDERFGDDITRLGDFIWLHKCK